MDERKILKDLYDILIQYTEVSIGLEHPDTSLRLLSDLKINSAHIIDLVLDIENSFGISISEAELLEISTVQDCLNIIHANR